MDSWWSCRACGHPFQWREPRWSTGVGGPYFCARCARRRNERVVLLESLVENGGLIRAPGCVSGESNESADLYSNGGKDGSMTSECPECGSRLREREPNYLHNIRRREIEDVYDRFVCRSCETTYSADEIAQRRSTNRSIQQWLRGNE